MQTTPLSPILRKPFIERAFELANAGGYRNLRELERKLHEEGYEGASHQLMAPTLRRQLRDACLVANKERPK